MSNFLRTSVEFLKGVGTARADVLKLDLNIFTFEDLLNHFPYKYVDRSSFQKISSITSDQSYVQVKGVIVSVEEVGTGKAKRLSAVFRDESGALDLVWFRSIPWIKKTLLLGKEYIVYGKPTLFGSKMNISHPEMTLYSIGAFNELKGLQPVYNTSENMKNRGLDSKALRKIVAGLLPQVKGKIPEILNKEIMEDLRFMSRDEAFQQIHQPANLEMANRAIARLKFDELFFAQLRILKVKQGRQINYAGFVFDKVGEYFNTFYSKYLPFELTGAQKRVIKEIRKDMGSGQHMNRLLQGDVGSGKTMVALMSILIALDNGYQAAIMAPTEILANQHYESFESLLKPLGIEVKLLTGSVKGKERQYVFEKLQSGELKVIVGTHALIEDPVQFKNIGLVVIDEQHRFGVAQRSKLWKKNSRPPHVLVMTATPIPRTLAMTLYGDLDTSVIDELPPGRKPISTHHFTDGGRLRVFGFMKEQIALGRQVYVVYPLIEESEAMDYKDLMDGYESIQRAFEPPKYQISVLHGRMKSDAKDFEMDRFKKGVTQIMVATTVIEVGVNVPNASVMVIESAERFGLSQLHQLRGRVGRGAEQSYCILMTADKIGADSKLRMRTMCETNDGFKIAEVDLKLRGPGDIEGTRQSGMMDFKIADLVKDSQSMQIARQKAMEVLTDDPEIKKEENRFIALHLNLLTDPKNNWSRIS
ncbi:MAG: ATP-dependent DNA helicase RecG [Flavobacteriales bacterium]